MRENDSIFNQMPLGYSIAGGMACPENMFSEKRELLKLQMDINWLKL